MTHDEFLQALRDLGFEEKRGELWGTVTFEGPRLEVVYDDDGRPVAINDVENNRSSRADELNFAVEPAPIDADFHFAASIIGSDDAEEFVHVSEDGPYRDHVFQNLHDEGLSTVEYLMDAEDFDPSTLVGVYSDDNYESVSKQTRLEWQPFFQNPVARSLADFVRKMKPAG